MMILKKIYGFSADETRGHTTVSSNLPSEKDEKRKGRLKKIFKDLVETDVTNKKTLFEGFIDLWALSVTYI
jgi:hypothetical protein